MRARGERDGRRYDTRERERERERERGREGRGEGGGITEKAGRKHRDARESHTLPDSLTNMTHFLKFKSIF